MNVALQHEAAEAPVTTAARWYVVWTKPIMERKADSELRWRGFDTYLPLRPAEGREKLRGKDFPAYPRYLFVRLDTAAPGWTKVFSTPGVSDVVRGAEGEIYPLPHGVVDALRTREVEGYHWRKLPRGKFKCGYVAGDLVKVLAGPFAGHNGVFAKALDPQSVEVTLFLFGRATPATLALDAIAASQ